MEITFTVLSLVYGALFPSLYHSTSAWHRPTPFTEDCVAFLVIAFSARKRGHVYAPGVPSLLTNIIEGATVYFFVVFAGQLLFIFFELLAPVSELPTDLFSSALLIIATQAPIQTLPGR